VALVITTDGTKVPVGLWLGDTENKTVVTALLADLVARGLSADGGWKIDWRLARAFADTDPAKGLDQAKRIAGELKAGHLDAVASLLEGLEEMFTVGRLGVSGRLASTLTNTNCIESRISVARNTMGNVEHRKDGSMKKRWVAAGMLEAERNFRRVRDCKEMPTLVAALRRTTVGETVTADNYDQAAA